SPGLPGGRALEKSANLRRTCRVRGSGGRRTCWRSARNLRTAAHEVDWLEAAGIRNAWVCALGKKVAHQVRLAFLRRDVKGRSAFIRGRRAGDAHGVGQRTCDLIVHSGAVLEEQLHQ